MRGQEGPDPERPYFGVWYALHIGTIRPGCASHTPVSMATCTSHPQPNTAIHTHSLHSQQRSAVAGGDASRPTPPREQAPQALGPTPHHPHPHYPKRPPLPARPLPGRRTCAQARYQHARKLELLLLGLSPSSSSHNVQALGMAQAHPGKRVHHANRVLCLESLSRSHGCADGTASLVAPPVFLHNRPADREARARAHCVCRSL